MMPAESKRLHPGEPPLLYSPVVHVIVMVLAVWLVYSNTLSSPFTFDDLNNIISNPAIRELRNFFDISLLEHVDIHETLQPLLKTRYLGYLSFAFNFALHGLDVRGYHLVNILIHTVNTLLVYGMLCLTFLTPRFSRDTAGPDDVGTRTFVALFTALLFAVHPIQTQAVTYIVQRFASLAALFYLLSLAAYIRFRLDAASGLSRRYLFYGISLLSAVAAMKTKEFALLLPVVVALYEAVFFEGKGGKRLLPLVPYALMIAIIPAGLMNVSARMVSGVEDSISRMDYLLTQFRVMVTYLRLLVFPVGQNVDYDYPVYHSPASLQVLLSFLLLAFILAFGIGLYRVSGRRGHRNGCWYRLAACGIFWFFITAAPESSIIPIKDVIFEHRMYLPSIGLFLAAAIAVRLLAERWRGGYHHARTAAVLCMAVAVVALSAATYARNAVWKSTVRLWEDVVRKSPGKDRAYFHLGLGYSDQGRYTDAAGAFNTAIRLNPLFPYSHYQLGLAYSAMGRLQEAIPEYAYAIKLKPDFADAHILLGAVYLKLGLPGEAAAELKTAVTFAPRSESAHNNLGTAYLYQGQVEDAIREYRAAITVRPDFADAHFNLGNVYLRLGRIGEANNEYRATLRYNPDSAAARRQLELNPGK